MVFVRFLCVCRRLTSRLKDMNNVKGGSVRAQPGREEAAGLKVVNDPSKSSYASVKSAPSTTSNDSTPIVKAAAVGKAETSDEFDRGRQEMLELAKDRIRQIKDAASQRILAGEEKWQTENMRSEAQIAQLRTELKAMHEDREKSGQKLEQYVAQVRRARQEDAARIAKAVAEAAYNRVNTEVKANELYDGASVLKMLRQAFIAAASLTVQALQ